MPLAPVLQMALQPVCENAGLRWTGPPINGWTIFIFATIAASFVATFVGIKVILDSGGF
jgi:hypothetical protein